MYVFHLHCAHDYSTSLFMTDGLFETTIKMNHVNRRNNFLFLLLLYFIVKH